MEIATRRGFYMAFFNVNRSLQCLRTSTIGMRCSSSRAMSTTRCLRVQNPHAKKTPQKRLDYRPSSKRPPPLPSATPPVPEPPKANPLRYRTIPIVLGGITLFSLSGYVAYLFVAVSKTPPQTLPIDPAHQPDASHRYDHIAETFDATVDWTEKIMGVVRLRKRMAKEARGTVLEVSVGTGRNFEFYDFGGSGGDEGKVQALTAIDKSAEMIDVARRKFEAFLPDPKPGGIGVRWIVGDASSPAQIPPAPYQADGKYDTVIQTMGLCSVSDPVALIKSLGEVVKPDEGRILLLEHGRGKWDWLNGVLDKSAKKHAEEFGCWWNRDLEAIVKESGLEVVKFETRHGGTTSWIELRKRRRQGENGILEAKREEHEAENGKPAEEGKKGWW